MILQFFGNETECGEMVHHLRGADRDTDVRVVPCYLSDPLVDPPDEWVVVATVELDLGTRCLKWATAKGCVCQLRNGPIYSVY